MSQHHGKSQGKIFSLFSFHLSLSLSNVLFYDSTTHLFCSQTTRSTERGKNPFCFALYPLLAFIIFHLFWIYIFRKIGKIHFKRRNISPIDPSSALLTLFTVQLILHHCHNNFWMLCKHCFAFFFALFFVVVILFLMWPTR